MPNSALLTYALASYPSPIQTSSPQSPLNANIDIGVINPNQAFYCSEIDVAVPKGPDATSLTAGNISSSLNTTTWSISDNDTARRANLNIPADETLISFICKDASNYLINYNLVLGLAAQVNNVVGECTIRVFETSGTSATNLTAKDPVLIKVSKESPAFYLQNLSAAASASSTIPATEFTSGTPFTLSWESNGTFFQIYQKNNPVPVYHGSQKTYTVQNGVTTDTTFFLVAMMTSDPSGDNPPSSYVPILLYDALTITVSNPSLNPASVTASGNITGASLNVSGAATLSGQTNVGVLNSPNTFVVNVGADFKNTLEVEGNLWVTQGTSTLNGAATFNGTATLNGAATFNAFSYFYGGVQISGVQPQAQPGQPQVTPSMLTARGNSLYMTWMPPFVDEATIAFKLSDGSGMLGYSGSSRTLKEDIQNLSDDFHKILQAQPVSFKFKGNAESPPSIGYIAEDFHDLGLHHLLVYNEKNEPLVIRYDRIAVYQLEIIKELRREVESLKEKIGVKTGEKAAD